eukprot:COSAG06_NODE_45676_length_353_cov_0.531496_1_plen_46_part_01
MRRHVGAIAHPLRYGRNPCHDLGPPAAEQVRQHSRTAYATSRVRRC